MRKYEAKRFIIIGRSGGDVSRLATMNMAAFEPCGCGAEDEINVPGNVAVFEILPATIQKHSILPSDNATATKHHAISINADCQRLAHRAGGIFKSKVLGSDVVRVDYRRRRPKGCYGFSVLTNHVRVKIESQHSLLGLFANQMKKPLLPLNVN